MFKFHVPSLFAFLVLFVFRLVFVFIPIPNPDFSSVTHHYLSEVAQLVLRERCSQVVISPHELFARVGGDMLEDADLDEVFSLLTVP